MSARAPTTTGTAALRKMEFFLKVGNLYRQTPRTFCGERKLIFRSEVVGPGSYKIDKDLNDPARGVSIGKAKRKDLTDYQETGDIGPGVYHKEQSLIGRA